LLWLVRVGALQYRDGAARILFAFQDNFELTGLGHGWHFLRRYDFSVAAKTMRCVIATSLMLGDSAL
jgi:hypothetical protein